MEKKKKALTFEFVELGFGGGWERLIVMAERWLWVREMVAAKVVVGERDGGGDGSGVSEMREEKIWGEIGFDFLLYQIRTRGNTREWKNLKKFLADKIKQERCSFINLFNVILTVKENSHNIIRNLLLS